MNAKKIEKWLLLEQTGELSPRQAHRLKHMLSQSVEGRKMREDIRLFSQSVKTIDPELSPWIAARIHSRLHGQLRSGVLASGIWKPALAMAACLALVAGILNFRGGHLNSSETSGALAAVGVDVWNVQYEDDLGQLESLISEISNDSFDIMEM